MQTENICELKMCEKYWVKQTYFQIMYVFRLLICSVLYASSRDGMMCFSNFLTITFFSHK